jgi:hypothetical protein
MMFAGLILVFDRFYFCMNLAGQHVIDENIGIRFPADPQLGPVKGDSLDGQAFVGKNQHRHFSSPFYSLPFPDG